ncbi:very-long-chain (3R)-3-hydroxyacyl-CoA dehydratase [Geosmithia morbida]|uniref:Very-long-chain (3R)-3-hydroxyacyl-CoA dehydratase n=1 Tax=Geosmithia morbida TaxID=1094350 RepID=A0A9P5D066_9HYPO|nr:very-long-chain (3R)-3-hydroxyacyl-CoA dehydratase [Geosmithia morbida]KAF4121292.1 very-long-chain (3R)-3-hydroxyacyl-CoA dehydratase [Geosmithia morbida]
MASSRAGQTTQSGGKKQPKPSSPVKTAYLVLYNTLSAAAWSVVLFRTLSIAIQQDPKLVHVGVGEWTKWTQTGALLEVLHSLLGIVRAPLMTTVMQVASRILLVWGVVHPFPEVALSTNFYSSMLIAWSVTEVIRYSFFAFSLSLGSTPGLLTWLRYNTFFVLYPLGITSECALIWFATGPAAHLHQLYQYALYAILAIYVPGSYTLYTYMMKQRGKVMRDLKVKKTQ